MIPIRSRSGLGKLKARGAKVVSVNPVRTGYSAIADEWIGIRPGTDGLFVLALVHELLRTDRIDLDFLVRYTNAHWLVHRCAGRARSTACSHAMPTGEPLCCDTRRRSRGRGRRHRDRARRGRRDLRCPTGAAPCPCSSCWPSVTSIRAYAPDAVAAERAACRRRRSAASPPNSREVAFDQAIELDSPWTDCAGRRHATIRAARSRCTPCAASRRTQRLSDLPRHSSVADAARRIDCPGGFRFKPPFPKPIPPGPKPAGKSCAPGQPLGGMPLGLPTGPEDLLLEPDGTPMRIDKAYSWEAPLAAHGLMHMVIANAWAGDPVSDRHAVPVHGQHGVELVDEHRRHDGDADRQGSRRPANTRIPHIIYSDAYASEMVAYADLVLPDTTYLERWDCISLLDRPISRRRRRRPTRSASRSCRPTATCAPSRTCCSISARGSGCPAWSTTTGAPRYPGGYADYIVNHERAPGHRPARRLARRRRQRSSAAARPIRSQLEAYVGERLLLAARTGADRSASTSSPTRISRFRRAHGFRAERRDRSSCSSIPSRCRDSVSPREGHGPIQPPDALRARLETAFDPLPIWYAPLERQASPKRFPLHALTQRPMTMYHSWGSQNAWLRQIYGRNVSMSAAATARAHGLADDDWAGSSATSARIRVPDPHMDGVQAGYGVDLERHRQARRRLGPRRRTRPKRAKASC